jgi:serine/threonine protein phosphatase PrpC
MGSRDFLHVTKVIAMRGSGQDRAAVIETGDGIVIALADGAGGTANGGLAAQAVIDAVTAAAHAPPAWDALLSELDRDPARLGHGQTTAVVLSVTGDGIHGASVGDSEAWVLYGAVAVRLTDGQVRKPLLGAGGRPVAIHAGALSGGTLLVASDGLFRYVRSTQLILIASGGSDLDAAARSLVDAAQRPTGGLQDDIAIVLACEATTSPQA